jgi:hypothetical protein
MEIPTRTWEAQAGLKVGYGLSNYTIVHDGFVYHGHNGSMMGGITEMFYLPEYGVGYFYSINAANGEAFGKIGDAIRAYITRGLARPSVPAAGQLPVNAQEWTGWYEPVAIQNEMMEFGGVIPQHLSFKDGELQLTFLGLSTQTFVPVSGLLFRRLPEKGPADPIASAALIAPNTDGRFVYIGTTMKRIPAWLALSRIALTVWFLLAFVAVILYAPFWIIGGFFKKRRRPAERAMRLCPLIAVLSLLAFIALYIFSNSDGIALLGNLTIWSFGIFLTSLSFAAASLASAVALWRARKQEIRRSVRWYSIIVTTILLIATAYLTFFGVIGIRTWS